MPDVSGVIGPVTFAPCGNGTNTNCTQAVAQSSGTNIGGKLVSHASDGASSVISLGATTSSGTTLPTLTTPAAAC